MSWIRPEQKVYETSDPQEAAFLRASTNWDVRLIEEEEQPSQQKQQLTADEHLAKARRDMGLPEQPQRLTEASEKQYTVTTDAELNSLARQAKAEIAEERDEKSVFQMYSEVVHAAYDAERAGNVEDARTGYKAAVGFLNGLHNKLADRSLGSDTVDARQLLRKKKHVLTQRLARL